jgi:hypothetical protein
MLVKYETTLQTKEKKSEMLFMLESVGNIGCPGTQIADGGGRGPNC